MFAAKTPLESNMKLALDLPMLNGKNWKKCLLSCLLVRNINQTRGRVTHVLDFEFVLNEFELQVRHYIHFWANTHVKSMNSLIAPAIV